ncbi:hypothetical protein G3M81_20575 [Bacillus paralicheniformis]|nr:hypothetical protein C6W27_10010 [Bacillus paralicheniformis]QII50982.1 hypothetical protein G3M81_20575 [Bacillus paralicheniformis]TAI50638.1 hypothetical protein CXP52_17570 [Bacillus paralicheniformis]
MYAKIGYYDKVFIAVIIMTSPLLKSFENPIFTGDRQITGPRIFGVCEVLSRTLRSVKWSDRLVYRNRKIDLKFSHQERI